VPRKKKNPRKHKLQQIDDGTFKDSSSIKQALKIVLKSSSNIDSSKVGPLEKIQVTGNNEISTNYVHT
jgi:hypothetical protein